MQVACADSNYLVRSADAWYVSSIPHHLDLTLPRKRRQRPDLGMHVLKRCTISTVTIFASGGTGGKGGRRPSPMFRLAHQPTGRHSSRRATVPHPRCARSRHPRPSQRLLRFAQPRTPAMRVLSPPHSYHVASSSQYPARSCPMPAQPPPLTPAPLPRARPPRARLRHPLRLGLGRGGLQRHRQPGGVMTWAEPD
jgi:hypothetical protein